MVSDEKLIEDLKELAEELGSTPTAREMNDLGDWNCDTYRRHFGSWNNSIRAANLEINVEHESRNVEDQKLIKELQEFAEELGHTPTVREMRGTGPRGVKSYAFRFGSWNDALREANLEINVEQGDTDVENQQLIKELQEFAEELGHTPTAAEMRDSGPRGAKQYGCRFGSWNDALKNADLNVNSNKTFVDNKEQLIEDLEEFAEELGRTPTSKEMDKSGPWVEATYRNYFGSWNHALKESSLDPIQPPREFSGKEKISYGEGYHKARKKCFSRDNYNCKVCGDRSQLHCHHIMPRREFENISNSNTLDNLITLCASCHMRLEGKWREADPDTFAENAQDYLES